MPSTFRVLCPCADPIDGDPSGLPVHLSTLVKDRPSVSFAFFYAREDLLRLDIFEQEIKRTYAWPATTARTGRHGKQRIIPFMEEDGDTAALECAVELFRPDIIHIHHLLGHTRSIYHIAQIFDLAIVHTLHDFYSLTSQIHFRSWPPTDSEFDPAIKGLPSIALWRKGMCELLNRADLLTAPSEFVFKAIGEYMGLEQDRCTVIHLGVPQDMVDRRIKRQGRADGNSALRVGIMGCLKLPPVWPKAFDFAPEHLDVHYFGHVPFEYEPKRGHQVTLHGAYERDKIVSLLASANLDLVALPAPTLETWSLALSEAWTAGLPVMAPRQGALAERLSTGGGWLYPPDRPEAFGEQLKALEAQTDLIPTEMARVAARPMLSSLDTATKYQEAWDRAIKLHARVPRKQKLSDHWTET